MLASHEFRTLGSERWRTVKKWQGGCICKQDARREGAKGTQRKTDCLKIEAVSMGNSPFFAQSLPLCAFAVDLQKNAFVL